MDAKVPRIPLLTVGKVAERVSSLDLAGQEEILERIRREQPIVLAYVVALAKQGVPYETIDHVAHVLMVVFECFGQSVGPLPQISEDAIIHEHERMQAMLRFFEGETGEEAARLRRLAALNHPEVNLLAYVVDYLRKRGLSHYSEATERALRVVTAIFGAFVTASRKPS